MGYGDTIEGADERYKDLLTDNTGINIVVSLTEDGYQGDDYWVVRRESDSAIGFLEIGWGSCSGCDAWEGANGYAYTDDEKAAAKVRLDELRDELLAKVHWEPTAEAFFAWWDARDWEGCTYAEDGVIERLRGMVAGAVTV